MDGPREGRMFNQSSSVYDGLQESVGGDSEWSICPSFKSTVPTNCASVRALLTTPPLPQERPDDFTETHRFLPNEPAYGLVQYELRLGIVLGRIVECYTNDACVVIYVLMTTNRSTSLEYHIPRFLLFHFHEDAGFVLQNEIRDQERTDVEMYSTPSASREKASKLINNVALSYASRFMSGALPNRRKIPIQIPGLVALGLPSFRLEAVAPQEDSNENPSLLTNENQIQTISSDSNSKSTLPVGTQYDPMFRRNFGITREQFRRGIFLRRLLCYAVENVCLFAMSRHRIFHPVNLQYLHSLISPVLTYYYMEAPAHSRRFLSMAHFSVVNDLNESSSTASFTCSFCKQTRNSRVSLRYHVQQQHLIVHYWTCQKCNKTFALPSMWRAHILECDPTFGLLILLNLSPEVIDAFADFHISRSPNNIQTLLYQPGLPDYRRNQVVILNSSRNALQQWPRHIHKRHAVTIKPCYRFEKKSSKRVRQQEEESDDSDDEVPVKGFIKFDEENSEAAMDCQEEEEKEEEEIAPIPSRPQTRARARKPSKKRSKSAKPTHRARQIIRSSSEDNDDNDDDGQEEEPEERTPTSSATGSCTTNKSSGSSGRPQRKCGKKGKSVATTFTHRQEREPLPDVPRRMTRAQTRTDTEPRICYEPDAVDDYDDVSDEDHDERDTSTWTPNDKKKNKRN